MNKQLRVFMNDIFSVFDSTTNSVKSNSSVKYYSAVLAQTTALRSIRNKQTQMLAYFISAIFSNVHSFVDAKAFLITLRRKWEMKERTHSHSQLVAMGNCNIMPAVVQVQPRWLIRARVAFHWRVKNGENIVRRHPQLFQCSFASFHSLYHYEH